MSECRFQVVWGIQCIGFEFDISLPSTPQPLGIFLSSLASLKGLMSVRSVCSSSDVITRCLLYICFFQKFSGFCVVLSDCGGEFIFGFFEF